MPTFCRLRGSGHLETLAQIDLAAEPPFVVGELGVRPSLLEVEAAGVCYPVPPRVMQVFVVLAGAQGRTVSRDELARRCWHDRIVGEDALNRVIAKLRAVALGPGGDSFTIETVKRIGYRLVSHDGAAEGDPVAVHTPASHGRRWRLVAAAAIVALAGGAWFALAPVAPVPNPAPPIVAAAADMETRGLSAVFEGKPERTAEGIAYLRQATAMTPRQAKVWGSLAMAYVLSLPDTPAAGRDAVVARIREAARRAQALDRSEGRSIAAIASLAPTFGHWQEKDRILRDGLARATPGAAPLVFQRALFLTAVGRSAEALTLIDQLNVSSPLVSWIQAARINLLAATGRPDEAERVAAWAGGLWPRDRLVWFTRFDLAAYGGRPQQALAFAASGAPDQTAPQEVALAVATATAMTSHVPREIDVVLADYRKLVPTGQGYAERGVRAAAALGRPGDALAFAAALYDSDLAPGPRAVAFPRIGLEERGERNTAILFVPPGSLLWDQPGFAALITRIGLVDYWRETGAPDLCHENAQAFCATLAKSRQAGATAR